MKNPFKKSSVIDTVVNVGIGGAANVGMNYLFENVDALASLSSTVKNAIKIGVGAIGGSMVSGKSAKYIRPAFDGIATVGASELISDLISGETTTNNPDGATGVPFIGKTRRMGQRGFRRVSGPGTGSVAFMEP